MKLKNRSHWYMGTNIVNIKKCTSIMMLISIKQATFEGQFM